MLLEKSSSYVVKVGRRGLKGFKKGLETLGGLWGAWGVGLAEKRDLPEPDIELKRSMLKCSENISSSIAADYSS